MATVFDAKEYGRQIQDQWENGIITQLEVVQCLRSLLPEHVPEIVSAISGDVREFIREEIGQAPKTCEDWAAFRIVLKDASADRNRWEYEEACGNAQRDYYRVVGAYRKELGD